jgi:hypothetical protein
VQFACQSARFDRVHCASRGGIWLQERQYLRSSEPPPWRSIEQLVKTTASRHTGGTLIANCPEHLWSSRLDSATDRPEIKLTCSELRGGDLHLKFGVWEKL